VAAAMSTFSSEVHLHFIEMGHPGAMKPHEPVYHADALALEGLEPDHDATRVQANVARWYGQMTPYWTTLQPLVRRRLVMYVHQWIAETAFVNGVLRADVIDDLGPGGVLACALADLIPADQRQCWQPWVRATLRDLRRALREPPARQTEAWWRRLFLKPSYTLATGPRPTGSRSA
jgi:hypothetical protein